MGTLRGYTKNNRTPISPDFFDDPLSSDKIVFEEKTLSNVEPAIVVIRLGSCNGHTRIKLRLIFKRISINSQSILPYQTQSILLYQSQRMLLHQLSYTHL